MTSGAWRGPSKADPAMGPREGGDAEAGRPEDGRPPARSARRRGRLCFRRPLQLTVRGLEDVVDEAYLFQAQDDQAVEIDLPPGVRDVGVPREAVMVVAQALAKGEDRGDELVGR